MSTLKNLIIPGRTPLVREDFGFMDPAQAATLEMAPRWASVGLLTVVGLFLSLAVWAYFAKLDVVSRGDGQIIPSSRVQIIQSLEGGILSSLQVSEGQRVEAGQELLRIDDTRFGATLEEDRARQTALLASSARLEAEATESASVNFPAALKKQHPDLVRRETALFTSRRTLLRESIANLAQSLRLARRERELIQPMVDKRIIVERDQIKLDRQIVELEGKVTSLRNEYRSAALEELAKQRATLAELEESVRGGQDRVARTLVRSPVRGIVKNIRINTLGGVIQPGDPILEVVPMDDRLLVEARLAPKDIAFVQEGQKATVKLSSYDFTVYGALSGWVDTVSADTLVDKDNNPYYRILVRTEKSGLGTAENPLPIIPGMTAQVDIMTGKKTVMNYILKPLRRLQEQALSER